MCGNTFQNTLGQVVIQHCASWGVLCQTTNSEIICYDFINSKSLHFFPRNELGKMRWCRQAAPKLPWSWSMPCARGTCSFCAWKVSQHIPFKVAPFFPCSSRGCAAPEDSSVSILFRKKKQESCGKEELQYFLGTYSRIHFTRRVLLAPGPLCGWITAPFDTFLTPFDGLGWLTCHAKVVLLWFCNVWVFFD